MNNNNKYPRVLLIYHSRINKEDQHGVSIRRWFSDWPKEHLAQIYSGGEVGDEVFCAYNFKLQSKERKFGKFFVKLKDSSLGQSSYVISLEKNLKKVDKVSFSQLAKYKISRLLISSGLWELIFRPILSKEMKDFITHFNPEIIFCSGYNLSFTWLPSMIHKKFKIPVCFHTGDDWLSSLYKKSPLAFILRPITQRAIISLLSNSSVKFSNGKLMSKVYKERYNMKFEPLMMCDNLDRFRKAVPKKVVDEDTISIIYSGNLTNNRWVSIIELGEVARQTSQNGSKIVITVFATWIPPEAINDLKGLGNIHILPAPSHEELPSYLKGADILFLPEPFDSERIEEIALSISTKVHLYMFSEKPALLYASPNAGTMAYANSENWGCRIQEHDLSELSNGLQLLLTNIDNSKKLVSQGLEIALKNHDETKVKATFLKILQEAGKFKNNN